MRLGLPAFGPIRPDMKTFDLKDAIADGEIKVREPIPDDDWRSEIAARDGAWIAWFEIDDHGALRARLGLTNHAQNEGKARDQQLVRVRPFTTPRAKIPIATVIGSTDIAMADRGMWSHADNKPIELVASALKNDPYYVIKAHPETGAPVVSFDPVRWRKAVNKMDATSLSGKS